MDSTTSSATQPRSAHRRVGAATILAFLAFLLLGAVRGPTEADSSVPAAPAATSTVVPTQPAPVEPGPATPGDPDPDFRRGHDRPGGGGRPGFGGGRDRGGDGGGGGSPGGGAAPAPSTGGSQT
jgi:uncharacterized membrane protein YgcG